MVASPLFSLLFKYRLTGSVLKVLSCESLLLHEVPEQHKEAWAKADVYVLRRWKTAKTERETIRALSWLGFLSQGLLRKTTRGGKVGQAQVAYRFNCISQNRKRFRMLLKRILRSIK